uniref:Uncharacterized protein n=1 Tax=Glossina austeni TaxID=7395 RepID=A0A1A9VR91_GLOAU
MFSGDSEDLIEAACDFQDAKSEMTENSDDDMEISHVSPGRSCATVSAHKAERIRLLSRKTTSLLKRAVLTLQLYPVMQTTALSQWSGSTLLNANAIWSNANEA